MKKLRIASNFDELMEHYFSIKQPHGQGLNLTALLLVRFGISLLYLTIFTFPDCPDPASGLDTFLHSLQRFTRYTGFREISSLSYSDQAGACSIVSAIEFDKDLEFFAVAGVTKKIKVWQSM